MPNQKTDSPTAALRKLRLIGMVHLPPLPGSAGYGVTPRSAARPLDAMIRHAVAEATRLARAGFDALIVENFGDAPFAASRVPPETIAAMAAVVDHVVRAVKVPVGVNVLRNDGLGALAVAAVTGAAFIRVNVLSGAYATDQGIITGNANELLARRAAVAPHVAIAADVHVKHATPISQPDLALAVEETATRAGADAIILSGSGTGKPTDLAALRRVREAAHGLPIWIGSGVTAATVRESLRAADAVIVGTALKKGGRTTAPLDRARVAAFIKAAGRK